TTPYWTAICASISSPMRRSPRSRKRSGTSPGRGRTARGSASAAFAARSSDERSGARMDHLLRELAPITDAAWREIDAEAARTLRRTLAARRLVDFSGPLGWDVSAVGRGRARAVTAARAGVTARLRETWPLVEIDIPFRLQRVEIDAIARGAQDADLGPVVHAARTAGLFEDRTVFEGFAEAGIAGIFELCAEHALTLTDDYERYPRVVAAALTRLRNEGVEGPYAIAL